MEGRRAVLGATLPLNAPLTPAQLLAEFDRVVQAVADRVSKRLQEEADPRRRSLILGYPAQLASLRARVARFFDGAFFGRRSGAARCAASTSPAACRKARRSTGCSAAWPSVYDSPPPARARQSGRAYFLNRLLQDVVFPEAGLVQSDPKALARRRALLTSGLIGLAVTSLLILVLWSVSFLQNRSLQDHLLAGAQNAGVEVHNTGVDLVEVREGDPNLEQSLSLLRAMRDLPRGYGDQAKGGAPILMRMGLFQGGHARAAREAYLETLQRVLLPRILLRLERYMQDHRVEPLKLYDALKVYLMLGGQGPMDPKAVKAWVTDDWATEALPGSDRAQVRDELGKHLDALLADKQFGRVWPQRVAPLDGALIEAARAAVQTLALADRAYAILRQKAAASGEPDWRAEHRAEWAATAKAFLNGDAVMQLSVPYFYTRRGFERAYQLGLQTVQIDLEKDLWVMGPDADKASIKGQVAQVKPGVASLYAKDYIATWDAVVKALQPGDYFKNPAALGAFTRTPSPLKVLLGEVRKNTTFGGTDAAAGVLSQARSGLADAAGPSVDAGKIISDYFRQLDDYVGDGKAPAPIDDFLGAVKQAGSAKVAAGVAGSGGSAGRPPRASSRAPWPRWRPPRWWPRRSLRASSPRPPRASRARRSPRPRAPSARNMRATWRPPATRSPTAATPSMARPRTTRRRPTCFGCWAPADSSTASCATACRPCWRPPDRSGVGAPRIRSPPPSTRPAPSRCRRPGRSAT